MHTTLEDIAGSDGTYQTAPRRLSAWARAFPSLYFYARFVAVIFDGAAQAKQNRYSVSRWYCSSLGILLALEQVGVSFDVSGVTHLKELQSPCVIVANHMSVLETVVLPRLVLPHLDFTFVVKESLLHYPVFKHIMRSRDPITVGRANPRADLKAVLTGGVDRLSRGISVIVFPQTTRTDRLDPAEFNSIGVKLALKAKVPVIPLALKTDAWGEGKLLKDHGKIDSTKTVRFAFGSPLEIQGRGGQEQQQIIDFITGHLQAWRRV